MVGVFDYCGIKVHAYRSWTDLERVPEAAGRASKDRRAGGGTAPGFSFLTHSFSDSQVPEVVHRDARRKGGARRQPGLGAVRRLKGG